MDTTVRNAHICQDCEDRFDNLNKAMTAAAGYVMSPSTLYSWFLSRSQCQACGTTEYGRRWRHEMRAATPEEQKASSGVCKFTEYDKQLAYAYGVKI